MDHDNRCVWVRLQQRSQLLTVLIRLEHPALVARKLPSQKAEYAPHIEVVRRLVVTEVVVPKFRNVCHPLPLIAGEVGNLQFVLTARVVRRLLVHDGEDGVLAQSLPSLVGPGPPRIGTLGSGLFAGTRRRLCGEIDRQVTQTAIRCEQVLEMSAPGAREGDDIDWADDGDVMRTRILCPIVLDQESVGSRFDAVVPEDFLVCFPNILVRSDLGQQ